MLMLPFGAHADGNALDRDACDPIPDLLRPNHVPQGGHGFGLCQTEAAWLEICDWPKQAQRFLQDHGFAPGWPQGKPEPPQMLSQGCDSD